MIRERVGDDELLERDLGRVDLIAGEKRFDLCDASEQARVGTTQVVVGRYDAQRPDCQIGLSLEQVRNPEAGSDSIASYRFSIAGTLRRVAPL